MGAWVAGWVGGRVGQLVGPGQIIKNGINLDLIEINQFCLKICDLLRYPQLWVDVWLVGWISGSMGGTRSSH